MSRGGQEHNPFVIANDEGDSAYKDGFRAAIDEQPRASGHSIEWHRGYKDGLEWALKNVKLKGLSSEQ